MNVSGNKHEKIITFIQLLLNCLAYTHTFEWNGITRFETIKTPIDGQIQPTQYQLVNKDSYF